VKLEKLNLVVLLDVKTSAAVQACCSAMKGRYNADGISAWEWCIWKLDANWYTTPAVVEQTSWFKAAVATGHIPLMIPVIRPETARLYNSLMTAKARGCTGRFSSRHLLRQAYSKKSYTVAFEVGLRSPGSILQEVVDFIRSSACPVKGLLFFAPLGDLHPADDKQMIFDVGNFDLCERGRKLRNLGHLVTTCRHAHSTRYSKETTR